MNKKIGALFLFIILFSNFVFASGLDIIEDKVNKIEETADKIEDLSDEEIRKEYLEQEWGKILLKHKPIQRVVYLYEKISPITNPISKYCFGKEPSFSFVFLLIVVLWLFFLVYLYRILNGFSFFSEEISFGVSFLFLIVIVNFGFINSFADFILNKLSLLGVWWVQLIGFIIVLFCLMIALKFSEQVELFFKERKKRRDKLKKDLKDIEVRAAKEDIKTFAKSIRKGVKKN